MAIQGISGRDMMAQVENLNNLLKNMTNAQMSLDNKMMKVNVVESVAGLGENIDISV